MELSKKLGLILGPIIFLVFLNLPVELISEKGDAVIAVALWMLFWWTIRYEAEMAEIMLSLHKLQEQGRISSLSCFRA